MKFQFLSSCLYVVVTLLLLGGSTDVQALPYVALTTNHTQIKDLTKCPCSVQFTCIATDLPYLQWFYNHSDSITNFSLFNNNHSMNSFPLTLSTSIVDSELRNSTQVVIVNASQASNSPSLANYVSTLTVDLSLLNQLGVSYMGCGTVNNYNETFISIDSTGVTKLTTWNIVLTAIGVLFWVLAAFGTVASPGALTCIYIEWWHGVYICQICVIVFLLVINAGLWIAFGVTAGNIKSDEHVGKRDGLCVSAFFFSLLALVWIVMSVIFAHVKSKCGCQCRKKTTSPSTYELEDKSDDEKQSVEEEEEEIQDSDTVNLVEAEEKG